MNIELGQATTEGLVTAYSPSLVTLSIIIAIFAAFTAFGISERKRAATQLNHKIAWNVFGGVTMGLGIWAMHFIGMLALTMPIPVAYDIQTTLVSVIPAIVASSIMLWLMTSTCNTIRLLMVGLLLGSGIGMMHYTGMTAMRLNATMMHDSAAV